MSDVDTTRLLADFCQAVADDLAGLVRLHDRELDRETLDALRQAEYPRHLGLRLTTDEGIRAAELMERALSGCRADDIDELGADYAAIYLNHALGASPLESVWLDDDHLACQGPMFEVRSWYARHGLAAEDWRQRPDDHLALQLTFIAHLVQQSGADALPETGQFLDRHLLRWLPAFAARIAQRCATPFYAALVLLTDAYCRELRQHLVQLTGEPIERIEAQAPAEAPPQPLRYIPGGAASW